MEIIKGAPMVLTKCIVPTYVAVVLVDVQLLRLEMRGRKNEKILLGESSSEASSEKSKQHASGEQAETWRLNKIARIFLTEKSLNYSQPSFVQQMEKILAYTFRFVLWALLFALKFHIRENFSVVNVMP